MKFIVLLFAISVFCLQPHQLLKNLANMTESQIFDQIIEGDMNGYLTI